MVTYICKGKKREKDMLTKEEIIDNAIADLEFAIEFIQIYGEINDNSISEHEIKIEDMRNSIDRLYELREEM